jgi:hypothetical protein
MLGVRREGVTYAVVKKEADRVQAYKPLFEHH